MLKALQEAAQRCANYREMVPDTHLVWELHTEGLQLTGSFMSDKTTGPMLDWERIANAENLHP